MVEGRRRRSEPFASEPCINALRISSLRRYLTIVQGRMQCSKTDVCSWRDESNRVVALSIEPGGAGVVQSKSVMSARCVVRHVKVMSCR